LAPDFPPNPGGVAVFVHNLCLQLSRLGHKVDVLTSVKPEGSAVDVRQPYRVWRYPVWNRLSSVPPILWTLRLCLQRRYDVFLVGHFLTTHALGLILWRLLCGVPYVVLCHGNDLRYGQQTELDKRLGRWIFSQTSTVLCNSIYTRHAVRANRYSGETAILHPGVDPTVFRPGVDTREVRWRHKLEGRQILLTVSRLTEMKNIDSVLAALPAVIERLPNILYLIVGDGEQEKHLKGLASRMGLGGHVMFVGPIENHLLPPYYCAADLYVMPSRPVGGTGDVETFGISFAEAGACGKAVIGGRVGGTEDAVIDGVTGLLVNPGDPEEITGAIIRLLTDKNLTRLMGENGRRRVERELGWEKVGDRLESLLNGYL
jgi:phosphatidylinositol alpha-1,6-mannosyltransferase